MTAINSKLLEILACPVCKSKVSLENDRIVCGNKNCGLRFPIRDGIPVMIADEAQRP